MRRSWSTGVNRMHVAVPCARCPRARVRRRSGRAERTPTSSSSSWTSSRAPRQRRAMQAEQAQMIEAAAEMNERRDQAGGDLIVDEVDAVMDCSRSSARRSPARDGGTLPLPGSHEPILGNCIVEAPRTSSDLQPRDPRSGFIADVQQCAEGCVLKKAAAARLLPVASVTDGSQRPGPGPAIAGRSTELTSRDSSGLRQGSRKGAWSPLTEPVVEHLTQDDMLAIVAYVSSQGR